MNKLCDQDAVEEKFVVPAGTLGEAPHFMSCCHSLSVESLVSTVPPPLMLPCTPYSSSQVTWPMQNKGLLHYNFWLGNSFSNKIWKSIEKNLHRSIKGRDIKKRKDVSAPLSFSLEAKFQLEEIALEQLNGSVRASPRQEQGGVSFLAGVLVFVHIGLHQVGHLTGVHLTTLAVTHLNKTNKRHSDSQ